MNVIQRGTIGGGGGGRDGEVLVRLLVSPSSWFSYSFFYMNFLEASHFRSIDFDFTR